MNVYGAPPQVIGSFDLGFDEYMHYMYLPILLPDTEWDGGTEFLPPRLRFASRLVQRAMAIEFGPGGRDWGYVYVTARRGFATPGNPLNRPGWHADGFGTDDINYVWTDRFPTLFAEQEFTNIEPNHTASMKQFESQINPARVKTYPDKALLRLDPYVIHSVPEIPAPGGERSFFKVSFSNERYALKGNSHNYLLDYQWPMLDRTAVRNDPARSEADSVASL